MYALVVASALCDPVRFAGRFESHQHGWILSLTPEHVAVYDGRASNVYNSPYSRFLILVIHFQYWVSQDGPRRRGDGRAWLWTARWPPTTSLAEPLTLAP